MAEPTARDATPLAGAAPQALVVGGGPTGLSVALLAARRGWRVALIEATDRLGGMSASIEVGGQRVDLGSHRLHPAASTRSMALLEELLGPDLQTRRRNGRIRLEGRWIPFPLSVTGMLRNLAPATAFRAGFDSLTSVFRSPRSDTFAEVIRSGLGPTVLDVFYGPYAPKLWGMPATELAGELARRRVSVSSPAVLVRKLYRSVRGGPPPFLYPRLGYGQIIDALRSACLAAGVEIETSCTVVELHHGPHRGVQVGLSGGRSIACDRVLWTAPPAPLLRVVGRSVEPIVPPSRAMVLVYLVVDCDRYTDFDAHYFPESAVAMARLSEPKNYRDGPDPTGTTVLCAELACDVGDDVWESDESELVARVIESIEVADLPPVDVVDSHVERLPSVYPVMTPANVAAFETMLERANSIDGVTVLGRQGLLVADNLHHVIDMAFEAAGSLRPDGSWDDERWRRSLVAFADHIVED